MDLYLAAHAAPSGPPEGLAPPVVAFPPPRLSPRSPAAAGASGSRAGGGPGVSSYEGAPPPPVRERPGESPVMRARRELRSRREHSRRRVASVLEEENRKIRDRIEAAGARGRDMKALSPGTERARRDLETSRFEISEARANALWEENQNLRQRLEHAEKRIDDGLSEATLQGRRALRREAMASQGARNLTLYEENLELSDILATTPSRASPPGQDANFLSDEVEESRLLELSTSRAKRSASNVRIYRENLDIQHRIRRAQSAGRVQARWDPETREAFHAAREKRARARSSQNEQIRADNRIFAGRLAEAYGDGKEITRLEPDVEAARRSNWEDQADRRHGAERDRQTKNVELHKKLSDAPGRVQRNLSFEAQRKRQHLKEQRRARSAEFRDHRRKSNEKFYARLSNVGPRIDNIL